MNCLIYIIRLGFRTTPKEVRFEILRNHIEWVQKEIATRTTKIKAQMKHDEVIHSFWELEAKYKCKVAEQMLKEKKFKAMAAEEFYKERLLARQKLEVDLQIKNTQLEACRK